jgi:hypothetical protein
MALDDPEHGRQAETVARDFRREERVEESRAYRVVHAAAVVFDLDAGVPTLGEIRLHARVAQQSIVHVDRSRPHRHPTRPIDRLGGVRREVQDDLTRLRRIDLDDEPPGIELEVERDRLSDRRPDDPYPRTRRVAA